MVNDNALPSDLTLDPDDWESMRALGHRMIDDAFDSMAAIHESPAWRRMPDEAKAHFTGPVPLDPQSPDEIYEEFKEYVLPYPVGNTHPRFWGWVIGAGTPLGALAEFLAGAMNTNTGGLDNHSANHVERQVIDWIRQMLAFPTTASGVLTSGCSAANLIGLAVARNARAGFDIRRAGLQAAPHRLTLYASQEVHSSVQKAVELLGLGSEALRLIPVNARFEIDLRALQAAIAHDRADGYRPFCVIGAAGTTNTGSIDDLTSLADICQADDLWLHVDGAFGAWAALAPGAAHRVEGMARADSLALDLHKWMYMPYEIGCVLIQREQDHRNAFSLTPDYLSHGAGGGGLAGGDLPWFSDYSFQLSRGFRALKAWMSLKEHGVARYAQLIQQNIAQADYLGRLVERAPELELMAPVSLCIVCFRYVQSGLGDAQLDAVNKRIEVELQERGIAVPSTSTIHGRCILRAAITNHRTRRSDLEAFVSEVVRIGDELAASL